MNRSRILRGTAAACMLLLLVSVPGAAAVRADPGLPEGTSTLDTLHYFPPDTLLVGGAVIGNAVDRWDAFVAFVKRFESEEDAADFDASLAKFREEMGFGLREDLLPLFRGEVAFGAGIESLDALVGLGMNPNPAGAEEVLPGVIVSIGVSNPQKFDSLLDKVLAHAGMEKSLVAETGGSRIWRIPVGDESGRVNVYYLHDRGRVLAGFSPAALTDAVSRFDGGVWIGGTSDFIRVRSHLPREVISLGYVNLPAIASLVRGAATVQAATASNEEARRVFDVFTSPDMVPFGIAWATSRTDGGIQRTTYGPDTLVSYLPFGGSGFGLPILAAIAVPNFFNAVVRGKQKRTMADERSIGTAVESFAVDENRYPAQQELGPVAGIAPLLEPTYIKKLPSQDAWKSSYLYWSDGETYVVVSLGGDGKAEMDLDGYRALDNPSSSKDPDQDIVYANGSFVRYPASAD